MRAAFAAMLLTACSQPKPADVRPTVDVLTGLPLFWGEGGVEDVLSGAARRSALVDALDTSWTLQPMDVARRKELSRVDRLLLIQPQALTPTEVFEIDRWLRKGGRALILADPDLRWPSTLPEGDPRRPPRVSLLSPLFRHWGVELLPTTGLSPVAEPIEQVNVVFDSPGTWVVKSKNCESLSPRIVRCTLGKGEVVMVSDVDFANPSWAQTTGGRNYAALSALMTKLWPKYWSYGAEQRKDKPPG